MHMFCFIVAVICLIFLCCVIWPVIRSFRAAFVAGRGKRDKDERFAVKVWVAVHWPKHKPRQLIVTAYK